MAKEFESIDRQEFTVRAGYNYNYDSVADGLTVWFAPNDKDVLVPSEVTWEEEQIVPNVTLEITTANNGFIVTVKRSGHKNESVVHSAPTGETYGLRDVLERYTRARVARREAFDPNKWDEWDFTTAEFEFNTIYKAEHDAA